jgi:hypothetical protein
MSSTAISSRDAGTARSSVTAGRSLSIAAHHGYRQPGWLASPIVFATEHPDMIAIFQGRL